MIEKIKNYEQNRSSSATVEKRLKVQSKQYDMALNRIK